MSHPAEQKHQLRKFLRRTRRNLSAQQQQQAALGITQTLKQQLGNKQQLKIALYYASDGEIDLSDFIDYCALRNIELYLPVIHALKPTLWFGRYTPDTPMYNNRFGIPEPATKLAIEPWQLSMVLMPLVGFDSDGGRLGMGGGFYDRTFAGLNRWPRKPKLIGVAHECQKVDKIPTESWDLALDGVITDQNSYF
ncbi:5-formyltetrahydrofolate cyclo-ligase [Reinekea thalattae]|uniref:5-formyltetrahydrofolate cyclo-ligase n=1 Tax=Reinekea thalattae TaxID=2593301 RepID=A0A5C8ZCA0_9GAMM|nr:5-formyltetrahydrofolate cyclo-ligase [Reinekea thalattae]TXR54801.1 5-formyltetrahydrofolate cyclo-ligase [Reinekea thalattae]